MANGKIESTKKIFGVKLEIQLTDRKIRLKKLEEAQDMIAELAMAAAQEVLGSDAVETIDCEWVYEYRWAEARSVAQGNGNGHSTRNDPPAED